MFFCSKSTSKEIERETRNISGWQVHIAKKLLETEAEDTAKALDGLKKMLDEIVRDVPAAAVAEMKKVPLYFSPSYQPGRTGAEFHPGAGWLRDNGRDPAMAQGVEFTGVHDFEAEMRRMPNFALHELAHAYHFRVLPMVLTMLKLRLLISELRQVECTIVSSVPLVMANTTFSKEPTA